MKEYSGSSVKPCYETEDETYRNCGSAGQIYAPVLTFLEPGPEYDGMRPFKIPFKKGEIPCNPPCNSYRTLKTY